MRQPSKDDKRVGIIVQARMGSTRLPGKIMMQILGRPMLEILIERLKRSKKSDIIVIATTRNKADDVIVELADRLGVASHRGDEQDVLRRYYEAARKYGIDVIVRITSDCPLMDPLLVDDVITYYFDNAAVDFAANTVNRTYPRGFDIEVFSFDVLKRAVTEAAKPYQREHVTLFMYENSKMASYEDKRDTSNYRVTVDTIEDFELIKGIFAAMGEDREFGYRDVIALLDARPDLAAINKHIEQKKMLK